MSERPRSQRRPIAQGPSGAWSLLIAIPLDAAGLYLVLAGLQLIPSAWPAPHEPAWVSLATAVALFASARAVAVIALRRLLRWRAASDTWSKVAASQHTNTR